MKKRTDWDFSEHTHTVEMFKSDQGNEVRIDHFRKGNSNTLLCGVICWLFGHKISETTDSGYLICDRCKKHEYYDLSFCNGMPFHKVYRFIKGIPMRIYYWYRLNFFNEPPF